jgi:hypothetical protein
VNHPHRYDFAVSYASEDLDFAKPLYELLTARGHKGFIDVDAEAELLGKHRPTHLADLFANDTEYVILVLSEAYFAQLRMQVELRGAITTAIRTKSDYLLPVQLDDAEWPTLLRDIVPVDARVKRPEEAARVIAAKLRGAEPPPPPLTEAPLDPPVRGLQRFPRHAKPEVGAAAVPFKVDEGSVEDRFRRWARTRWRAREDFRKELEAGARRAVYLPFWIGEADLYIGYRGSTMKETPPTSPSSAQARPAERVQVDREFLHKRYPFTRPAFYPDAEFGPGFAKHLEAIRPWNLEDRFAATPEQMSDFDRIDRCVSAQESASEWHPFSANDLNGAVRADLGGTYPNFGRPKTRAAGVEAEIRYLPVWVVDWEFESRRGRVLINGQTGAASGSEYRSVWKSLALLACVIAVTGLLFALLDAGADSAQNPGEGAGATTGVTESASVD